MSVAPDDLLLAAVKSQAAVDAARRDQPTIPVPSASPWPTIDPAAYYGLAGDLVRTIAPHTEADPIALLMQSLIFFGNALNRGPHTVAEADRHATTENATFVGETAKARKGTSAGRLRRIFEFADPEWATQKIASGLSSGEGLIWAVRDPIFKWESKKGKKGEDPGEPALVMVDPGVDDKRLLVLEEEFANLLVVMTREGNNVSPIIRQAWDGKTLQTLTKNSPAKSTGAHISIVGHITTPELRKLLSKTQAANGFGNRFLWLMVRRSKELPEGGALHTVDLEPLVRRLQAALTFARTVGEVKRDGYGRGLWCEVYHDLSASLPGMLGAVTARAEAHTMRLSMLYALMDQAREVGEVHLRAALALWSYCLDSARYVFGEARLGDTVADEILAALRGSPQGLTRTQIRDLFRRHTTEGAIVVALGELQAAGLARCEHRATRGRPVEVWVAVRVECPTLVHPDREVGADDDKETTS